MCVDNLIRKFDTSLNLLAKERALVEQCGALQDGRVPAGVKPFKISVDVPELDQTIPAELCLLKIELTEGSTFREAKESCTWRQSL